MTVSSPDALGLISAPASREDFKRYCLRRLGSPLNKINVSDEQIQDRINDALLMFFDYHFEGSEKTYYKYQLTDTDITNKYITLPDNIIGAVRMFEGGDAFNSQNMFNFRYQFSLNDLYPLTSGSVLTYHMTMTQLAFLEQLFVGTQPVRYNRFNNRFYIDMDWSRFSSGQYLIVEAYKVIDPILYTRMWSDRWLCRYGTALIKRQYGTNLKKYSGMKMLGDIAFNGQQIYDEANQEIEELEHEMINSYSLPVSDMIG